MHLFLGQDKHDKMAINILWPNMLLWLKFVLPVSQMICASLIKSAHESWKGHPLLFYCCICITYLIKHL